MIYTDILNAMTIIPQIKDELLNVILVVASYSTLMLQVCTAVNYQVPEGNIHSYEYTEGFKFLLGP